MNDIKKIQEFFSKSLEEAKTENSYKVVWTDRDYKKYSKVFKNDPKGAPDNAKKKAEEFKKALEDKDKKSKDGLYRSIDLNEAKEETAIDMAKKKLDALGVKYEMSGNNFKPFEAIYRPNNKSNEFYDKFNRIVYEFNLGSAVKQSKSMNEAKSSHFKIGDVVELKNFPENLPYEIRNGIVDNKWEIIKVSKSGRSMYSDVMEDVFGYDIELLDKKLKYKMFVYPEDVKSSMNEAKSEDKVDTITMDIPLFLRMLEYAREDAEQDLDLHDVTEKANKLGKERGILQIDDYEEIVGTTEKTEENVAPNHDGKAAPYGSGYKPLEERISEALDKINEELCPAGKAYVEKRKKPKSEGGGGEKHSAYLMGRASKVCKGQMSGKKKKK